MNHAYFLKVTIEMARENIENGGGPFAAIVVNGNGEIVGIGKNSVTKNNDPTAHAEVQAIRDACQNLGTFQLADCILYSSCEPCPMCLGAIYWARPKEVYFAADQKDAANAGFDDAFIYEEITKDHGARAIRFNRVDIPDRTLPFEEWEHTYIKINY